jgi:hypothetical protein
MYAYLYLPALRKQAAIVPVLKKSNCATVSNYRPNKLFKLSEFVIHAASYYLKFKLNPCQHGFTKSISTMTSLVTYLVLIAPLAESHRQACDTYFDLSNAFNLTPHILFLSNFVPSCGYVKWFTSYLSIDNTRSVRLKFLQHLLKYSLVFLKYLFWVLRFSVCLLMTCVIQLITLGAHILQMILTFTVASSLLKTSICYSLIGALPHV